MLNRPLYRIIGNALAAFSTTALALQASGLLNTADGWKAVLYTCVFTALLSAAKEYQKLCESEEEPKQTKLSALTVVF